MSHYYNFHFRISKKVLAGISLVFLFLFSYTETDCQELRFDHLTYSQGLSNSHISDIYQDSTGFIWLCTEDGLNRFDGYSFRVYRNLPDNPESLSDNNIINICGNRGDDFWVATYTGVAKYSSSLDRFHTYPLKDSLGHIIDVQVHYVTVTNSGKVLVGTNIGLFEYIEPAGGFQPVQAGQSKTGHILRSNISCLYEDRDQVLWMGMFVDGVYRIGKGGIPEMITFTRGKEDLLKNNKVLNIYEDSRNIIWISTENGLYGYDKSAGKVDPKLVFRAPVLPHPLVNTVYEDSRKNLWVGSDGGLGLLDPETGTFRFHTHNDLDENTISHNAVSVVFEDGQRNLWTGTKEEGVNIARTHVLNIQSLQKRTGTGNGLNYSYVLSVLEDRNGEVWIGTNGGGLNRYNKTTKSVKYYTPRDKIPGFPGSDAIQCLFEDSRGLIWIGSYGGGLTQYDARTGKFLTYLHRPGDEKSISSNVVNAVYEDSRRRLWIATHGGFSLFDRKTASFSNYSRNEGSPGSQLSSNFVSSFIEDQQGFLWVGTYKGLNRYNPQTGFIENFSHSKTPGSISNNIIYCFYADADGEIWIGTANGLNRYNPVKGNFTAYFEKDGLPNNTINAVTGDENGNLWISTNKGIAMFDPGSGKIISFTTEDGLPGMEFHHGSYFKSADGTLYFGCKKGLSWFNPGSLKTIRYQYPLVITDFRIFSESIFPGDDSPLEQTILKTDVIRLRHSQSFISFGFTALNFVNQSKDVFRYRLEGLEENWITLSPEVRMASYSNLPPGNYIFHVKVTNQITQNEAERQLRVIVHPPFWKSSISYVIYWLLLVIAGFAFYGYMKGRSRSRQKLLVERMEKEKVIEINQAKLRFFINVSHEFKTPLTLILSPLEKLIYREKELSPEERGGLYRLIYRNASRLSRLINQIMDLRKLDAGNMELYTSQTEVVEFIYEVTAYFEEQARNHAIDFRIRQTEDQVIAWVDREKFEKILFNLISNAFKYTPDGETIELTVGKADREESGAIEGALKIVVSDTGTGIPTELQGRVFDRFFQAVADGHPNPASTGIGLSIVREFVELHHGKITLSSIQGKGSTFTVYIPLGTKHLKPEEIVTHPGEHFFAYSHVEEFSENEPESVEKPTENPGSELNRVRKKILVVEDNYELRNFLMDNLEEYYDVYEAADGEEGLTLVQEVLPEIVISDVMMPKMTGIELCRAIKSDVKISHIPVVLITVLDAQTSQIEGLESGADDYLTKPFSIQVLELKIRNLMDTRRKLVGKFMQEVDPDVKVMASNKTDERFLLKATAIVEKNLANPDFSAEDFAHQLGMSRSNVHVKLRALVNQSSTEFIRTLRIKTAARLLATTDLNVSEVSFKVGFNNISYFNRCFKKHFSMPPSDYIRQRRQGTLPGT
ncbi:MAG: two-component regulator propeller domain-containing protein [Bacteroidales bacterium]